jgi:hypothetical protein
MFAAIGDLTAISPLSVRARDIGIRGLSPRVPPMGEAEITRSTACTKEQLPRIASTRTQGGSSMNGFAGTNSSHGWDRASERQKLWGDPAEEAGAGRDVLLDDRINDRPSLVEQPSHGRLIDRQGDPVPRHRPQRRTAGASRAAAGAQATMFLGDRVARGSPFPKLSWLYA